MPLTATALGMRFHLQTADLIRWQITHSGRWGSAERGTKNMQVDRDLLICLRQVATHVHTIQPQRGRP